MHRQIDLPLRIALPAAPNKQNVIKTLSLLRNAIVGNEKAVLKQPSSQAALMPHRLKHKGFRRQLRRRLKDPHDRKSAHATDHNRLHLSRLQNGKPVPCAKRKSG